MGYIHSCGHFVGNMIFYMIGFKGRVSSSQIKPISIVSGRSELQIEGSTFDFMIFMLTCDWYFDSLVDPFMYCRLLIFVVHHHFFTFSGWTFGPNFWTSTQTVKEQLTAASDSGTATSNVAWYWGSAGEATTTFDEWVPSCKHTKKCGKPSTSTPLPSRKPPVFCNFWYVHPRVYAELTCWGLGGFFLSFLCCGTKLFDPKGVKDLQIGFSTVETCGKPISQEQQKES